MATMHLLSAEYVTINAGGTRFPVVRLIVDPGDWTGDSTFTADGLAACVGMTLNVSINMPVNASTETLRNFCDSGNLVYGDDNGWKVTRTNYSSGGRFYYSNYRYQYKGTIVSEGTSPGLFSLQACHVGAVCIITDSQGNVYTTSTGRLPVAWYDDPAALAISDADYLVGTVPTAPTNIGQNPILSGVIPDVNIDDIVVPVYSDPYEAGAERSSGPGGGTGTFSETGDTIGIPGLPALSAVDTGFITLFNPSAAQVKALAAYMWSSSFDLATFKNIVANPIDCILGLTIVPVDPSNAGSKTVTVGNIPTNITLPYLSSQYVEVDCGTLNVQEFWGSYLDYSPYTKMSLYLPYIGIIPLDIDDVMNASIAVKYHVDVLSGACVAYVLCNGTQLYTYVGQCSSNVPITSNDFTNTVNGILGIAGALGKLSADGGASAPTAISEVAANAINALKPNIQKSGAMSGTGGLMGVQTPYLICQRPRQSVPHDQNAYTGYPANITARLSDLSGYTEVESIHLDGLSATQEEQQEIMDLLTSGVII